MTSQEQNIGIGQFKNSKPRPDGSTPGWSLSREYYKDPSIFEREKEKIIYNSWIFAGHVSQIPNIGDFFRFNLLDESAIIVRTKDKTIIAYYNVCRHRGSQICIEDTGNVKRFLCPYHAWSYDLDGTLVGARGMPDGFDKSGIRLHDCPIDIIDGLIFINFSDNPTSLENAKKDLSGPMEMYDFNNMKVISHNTYPIAGNWKVTLENYQECYHCAPSHPEYSLAHTRKVGGDKFYKLQLPMLERMDACNIKHFEVDKQFGMQDDGQEQYAYSRYALYEKYKTGSQDGEQLAPFLGTIKGFDHGTSDLNVGPLTYFLAYNDHVVVYVFTPTGHETSACDIYWLVRGDAIEGEDYDIEKVKWLWDVTTMADERIIVGNQKGINSHKYSSGPLSKMEFLVEKFINWYLTNLNLGGS